MPWYIHRNLHQLNRRDASHNNAQYMHNHSSLMQQDAIGLLCAINRVATVCYNYLIMYQTSSELAHGKPTNKELNYKVACIQRPLNFHRGVAEWLNETMLR